MQYEIILQGNRIGLGIPPGRRLWFSRKAFADLIEKTGPGMLKVSATFEESGLELQEITTARTVED